MLTLNMTAGNDNALVWVVKIELEATPLRYATRALSLTNSWLAGKIAINTLEEISGTSNIMNGGCANDLSMVNFQTTKFSLWIDDIAPTTSMPVLTGKRISIGFVWDTATTDAEITWLFEGFVNNFTYSKNILELDVMEYSDLEAVILPYYQLQNMFDNGIDYTTKVPEDSLGTAIPIIYGDFTKLNVYYDDCCLSPAVLFDENILEYKYSSHPCHTVNTGAGGYGSETLLYAFEKGHAILMATAGGNNNNLRGARISFFTATRAIGDAIAATIVLPFVSVGSQSDIADAKNCFDIEYNGKTKITLANGEQVSFRVADTDLTNFQMDAATERVVYYAQVNLTTSGANTYLKGAAFDVQNDAYLTPGTYNVFDDLINSTSDTVHLLEMDSGTVGLSNYNNIEFVLLNNGTAHSLSGSVDIFNLFMSVDCTISTYLFKRKVKMPKSYSYKNAVRTSVTIGRSFGGRR